MTEAEMLAGLAELGVAHAIDEHAAVYTVEDSADLYRRLPGVHTKNLFLKDAGGRFWLVTVPATARVDLKALAPAMGSKKLSFGGEADMVRLLGVAPGAVTPLAACNDEASAVTVVLDAAVVSADRIYVHPLRNTATLGLAGADLVRSLTAWRHVPKVLAVPLRADQDANGR